ncbi:MAG: ferrous iron transport protein B [Spirochaetaceae bacterium]|jgi:ferrous iron transport protein B|nr:ferrous iron transport protein B [Spirochaetaceae bacterium]
MKTIRIGLSGNPNSGKSTLFNALTGAHRQVGNYPGVTVEKHEGTRTEGGITYHFVDLPGTYSLTAYSLDEVVARDFILNDKPDLVVDVLDSTNLERNLYLCMQMQELGLPVAGALNMIDEAEAKGIEIDEKQLSETLGIPFVKMSAKSGRGIEDLLKTINAALGIAEDAGEKLPAAHTLNYGTEIESRLSGMEALIAKDSAYTATARWLAVKLLEKDEGAQARLTGHAQAERIFADAKAAREWIEGHFGRSSEIVFSEQRYAYIHGAVKEAVRIVKQPDFSLTEKIDAVIMNKFLALPVFLVVLWGVFQLTFTIGAYPQGWVESFFGFLSGAASAGLPDGLLRSLVVDGIIAGLGGVLSFVPLIVLLFFFLSILEDLGYISRAAFATDRFLHSFGLHGQSLFPLMLGFGCSVPAMMASRTLKSSRDRIITMLVTPMMSCGAKLPIHLLFAAVFFPENPARAVMLLYICGIVLAIFSAFILKRTVLKGAPTPFVMELPPYRAPTARGVLWHVWEKSWEYLKRAGTVLLAVSILIWALTAFPAFEFESEEDERAFAAQVAEQNVWETEEELEALIETAKADRQLNHSFAGRAGHAIAPIFAPLGFNWRLSVSIIPGFAAKEVVVSTLGIIYRSGMEESEESETLQAAIAADPSLNRLAGFSFMLFMLLIPPCLAALTVFRAEIGGKWLLFEFIFLTILGYLIPLAVYQIGSLIG